MLKVLKLPARLPAQTFLSDSTRSERLSIFGLLLIAYAFVNVYWIAEFRYAPASTMAVHNLYQGDDDYFPPTYHLSRGHMTEAGILEKRDSIFPFPIVSMSMHAAFISLLGDWGWITADLVATGVVIAMLFWLFRCSVGNGYFAALATFLITVYSSGPNLLESISHRLFLGDVWDFYGYRFPRPLVTTMFVLLQIIAVTVVLRSRSRAQLLWRGCMLALACSAILQGDLHAGLTSCMVSALILVWCSFRLKRSFSDVLMVIGVFGAVLLLSVSPFLYQSSQATADLRRRWGRVFIPRSHPLFLPHTPRLLAMGLGAALCVWLFSIWRRKLHPPVHDWRWAQPLIAVLACFIVSIIALPVSNVILGQGIQMGHFLDRCMRYWTLLTVCLMSVAAHFSLLQLSQWRKSWMRLRPDGWSFRGRCIAAIVLLVMPVAYYGNHGIRSLSPDVQVRTYDGWPAIHGYRTAFEQLCQFLARNYQDGSTRVLGTFDHQVRVWWQAKMKQWVFVPDPGMSAVSDEEIERRLISFCRELGFSEQAFSASLRKLYFNLDFLGALKYQVHPYYHFAAASDYEPSQLSQLEWYSLHLAIPSSEMARLIEEFRRSAGLAGQLDLIVLNKSNRFADYQLLPGKFTKVFENTEFEVWQSAGSLHAH